MVSHCRAVASHISVIVSTVMPAMCGLAMTLSMFSSGWAGSGGSLRNTSSPAPAMRPSRNAASSAGSSWMPPRAVLMKYAEGFIAANCAAPNMPKVSELRGQCTVT